MILADDMTFGDDDLRRPLTTSFIFYRVLVSPLLVTVTRQQAASQHFNAQTELTLLCRRGVVT